MIDQLRREVAQLRGRLNQAPRESSHSQSQGQTQRQRSRPDQGAGPVPGKSPTWTQHALTHTGYNYDGQIHGNGSGYATGAGAGAASARGTPDTGEGSWRGSSPSSSITTMTNSATVTSPDSTGSENGAGSMSTLSRSASASAYPVATGYGPQVAELDGSATVEPLAFGSMFDFVLPLSDASINFGRCSRGYDDVRLLYRRHGLRSRGHVRNSPATDAGSPSARVTRAGCDVRDAPPAAIRRT
jgi:hypothetical protein